MASHDDLPAAIFDGRDPTLYAEFAEWTRESRRFRAFAATYRIRFGPSCATPATTAA